MLLKSSWRCMLQFQKRRSSHAKKSGLNSVVGIEVHAQINSISKLFSGASTSFGTSVNSSVSLFDAAIPGTLPVLNKRCVEAGVLTALALNCEINEYSLFDRKHYFYADLPAGYQITQQRKPIAQNGCVPFSVLTPGGHTKPYSKVSRIKQIQLEQDSGKSIHDEVAESTLIDLNRAGVPLMELVFEPDLADGEEAAALVKELALILTTIDTCSCKMEEGALRVDANISVHKPGEPLGVRTEVKNIGSVRGVAKAIDYEIKRQIKIISNGGSIINETRTWDAESGTTLPMRDKEVKQDYRFMPEPNLPPLRINMGSTNDNELVNFCKLKNSLPELPEQTRLKLKETYQLSSQYVLQIVNERALLKLFLKLVNQKNRNAPIVAKILLMELMLWVNQGIITLDDFSFFEEGIGTIIDLYEEELINLVVVRKTMEIMFADKNNNVRQIIESRDWYQIKDRAALKTLCEKVMENNPKAVKDYRAGKTKAIHALLGAIVKSSDGRVHMKLTTAILTELLNQK